MENTARLSRIFCVPPMGNMAHTDDTESPLTFALPTPPFAPRPRRPGATTRSMTRNERTDEDVEPYRTSPRTRRRRIKNRAKLQAIERVKDPGPLVGAVYNVVFYASGWDQMERWLADTNSHIVQHHRLVGTDEIESRIRIPGILAGCTLGEQWWVKSVHECK